MTILNVLASEVPIPSICLDLFQEIPSAGGSICETRMPRPRHILASNRFAFYAPAIQRMVEGQ